MQGQRHLRERCPGVTGQRTGSSCDSDTALPATCVSGCLCRASSSCGVRTFDDCVVELEVRYDADVFGKIIYIPGLS
jgi:hypothetical protein